MGTIRFELRDEKSKIDKDGKASIRLVYQIQGQRKYFNTGEKIYPANWDDKMKWDDPVSARGKAVYSKAAPMLSTDVKKINTALLGIIQDVREIENRFIATKTVYTPDTVLQELKKETAPLEKKAASSKEVYAFIERYIEDHQLTRVKGSLQVYKSLKMHLQDFERQRRAKVTFENVDIQFFKAFQNFLVSKTKQVNDKETGQLKTVRALNNITIAKQLTTLKTFLNYAKKDYKVSVNPGFRDFTVRRNDEQLEVIALTWQEFETLYQLDVSERPAWRQVLDVFLFSCTTGLRFSDLRQLRWEHIREDEIDITAIKTGHKTTIPLNPFSKAILDRYKGEPRPLPVISNQKSNEHLEKICKHVGFDKKEVIVRFYGAERVEEHIERYKLIRMHCGRKTFATLSLSMKMPAERVMAIGGWVDYKSFERYINVSKEEAKRAMNETWGAKVINPKLKAV